MCIEIYPHDYSKNKRQYQICPAMLKRAYKRQQYALSEESKPYVIVLYMEPVVTYHDASLLLSLECLTDFILSFVT
jgi:hypothetical protein